MARASGTAGANFCKLVRPVRPAVAPHLPRTTFSMQLGPLDHFTILTSPAKLSAIEAFYDGILGLKAGPRPDFPFPGRWLYHEGKAILHLVATLPDGAPATPAAPSECIEHVAFKARGAAEFRERLAAMGVAYTQAQRAMAGYQIFVRDPAGVRVEFNFDSGEAPNA
jgi:catechol 2,3-dioxygenase-like lactoylglutathione lyase family enzyme